MSTRMRRLLLFGLGGLVTLAILVVGGTYLYVNVISDDAPAPLALDESGGGGASVADLEGTWTITHDSEAGYRVDEVLNGQDNTVVGRTSDVSGQITVADGAATDAEVVVDMTTVTTDSGSRDSQFRGPIMLTDEFPTATFRLTEPVSVADMSGSGPVSVTAAGELTLRDVTRPVEAKVDVQSSGEDVQVAGSIPITFADFGIDPPNLGFVRVENSGVVEFLLTLEQDGT